MADNDLIEYRAIYLKEDKNSENRIIVIDPILESEGTGILVLKSLRLKDCYGLVLSAPPVLLRNYLSVIKDFEKTAEFKDFGLDALFERLNQFANVMKVRICYSQKPSQVAESKVPNLEELTWSPKEVHKKLDKIVDIVNKNLPEGVFLQQAEEPEDDVPVVRLLTGTGDPYTAERWGSLALYSSQRGLEWYEKNIGPVEFIPNTGQVFVTYYDDMDKTEEPLLELNLEDPDLVWVDSIIDALGVKKKNIVTSSYEDLDLIPPIKAVENAKIGIGFSKKHGEGYSFFNTPIASQIITQTQMQPNVIKKMHSFFLEHEKIEGTDEKAIRAYNEYLLCGGAEGHAWVKKVWKAMRGNKATADTYPEPIDLRVIELDEVLLQASLNNFGKPLGEYLPHTGMIDDVGNLESILYEHKNGNQFYITGPETEEMVKHYISEKTEADKLVWQYYRNKDLAESIGFKVVNDTDAQYIKNITFCQALSSWKYNDILLNKDGYTIVLERKVDTPYVKKVARGFLLDGKEYRKVHIPQINAWKMANSFHPHRIKAYLASWVRASMQRGDYRFLGE